MKRVLMFLAMATALSTMAQEGPIISSAIIADRNQDLPAAKKYIDEAAAIVNAKPEAEVGYKDMRKFLYFNGKINLAVATSNDAAIQGLDPLALEKAEKSILRSIKYEKELGKEKYLDDSKALMGTLAASYANQGITQSSKNEYAQAYKSFLKTYELKKMDGVNQTDTSNLYNAALMAQNAEMYNKAVELNKELIELGYRGFEYKATDAETGDVVGFPNKTLMDQYVAAGAYKDPQVIPNDLRPNYYIAIAGTSMRAGDTATYTEYVTKGRKAFPENPALLTTELDIYIRSKQYDKALVNLDEAIKQNPNDPKSKIYYYNKGIILHTQMSKPDEALPSYSKAIELDSTYTDALYMHGLVYYDKAKAVTERMNELPLNAKAKYDAAKKEQQDMFKKALPYFEKASEAAPEDKNTLLALAEIYRTLKMSDKALETTKKIQSMP